MKIFLRTIFLLFCLLTMHNAQKLELFLRTKNNVFNRSSLYSLTFSILFFIWNVLYLLCGYYFEQNFDFSLRQWTTIEQPKLGQTILSTPCFTATTRTTVCLLFQTCAKFMYYAALDRFLGNTASQHPLMLRGLWLSQN